MVVSKSPLPLSSKGTVSPGDLGAAGNYVIMAKTGITNVTGSTVTGNIAVSPAAAKNIILAGGAQAKNIFWQVAGHVTIGTTSHFEGVILSKTAINLQTGASLPGRALAQSTVTLDNNAVTQP